MAGDFNTHSNRWDDGFPTRGGTTPDILMDVAARLGVSYSRLNNYGVTHISNDPTKQGTVIDLVFCEDISLSNCPTLRGDLRGTSDHIPLLFQCSNRG